MWAARYWANRYWGGRYFAHYGANVPPPSDVGGVTIYDPRHNKTLFVRSARPTLYDQRVNETIIDNRHTKTVFLRLKRRTIYGK